MKDQEKTRSDNGYVVSFETKKITADSLEEFNEKVAALTTIGKDISNIAAIVVTFHNML